MLVLDRPRDTDIHTLADFAELLCLLTIDRVCSRETISDQIHDMADKKLKPHELDDCFNQIAWRVEAFGDKYPFTLDEGRRILSAPEVLPDSKKPYVLLLLCANLPFFDRDRLDGSLTDAFERFSLLAMRSIFPVGANIRAFGKNETDYVGQKWERINTLAQDIGARGVCTPATFRQRDVGDGGIDLVGWLTLDPYEGRNIPSALGQCACSRSDWPKKQSDIGRDRLAYHIVPTHPWMQMIFIPHSFRDNNGVWAFDGEIGSSLVFDRLRIASSFNFDKDWAAVEPPPILAEFLDKRLDLV